MYGPALTPLAVALVCTGVVFQLNVYGAVPPLPLAVALPVLPPKQSTSTCPLIFAASARSEERRVGKDGAVQLLASLTVKMYGHALNPLAVALVCTGEVFQIT